MLGARMQQYCHNLYVRISYQQRFMLPDQSLYLDTKFCRVEEPSTAS
jgi:hypothetical protein